MTPEESTINAFKVERYKFILQQLDSLNQNHHKYLALFETLITAVISAGVALFVGWRELKLDPEAARIGLRGLFGLVFVLTVFLCFSTVAGAFPSAEWWCVALLCTKPEITGRLNSEGVR